MVHDSHDAVMVPPFGILNALDFTSHHNDLTGGDQLATSVGRFEVLRNASLGDIAIQGLGKTVDHLCPLARAENVWRARGQDKVTVQINDQCVGRGSK